MPPLMIRPRGGADAGLALARRGFTLIELLVALAVVALVIAIAVPAIRSVRRSGGLARELSLARQLMTAYRSYAYDHRGMLVPGYAGGFPIEDELGRNVAGTVGVEALSYVYRLKPYLDHNLRGLYLEENLLPRMRSDEHSDYTPAVYPALGINGTFLGGDKDYYGFNEYALTYTGRFYAERLSEVKRPADVLVFASARIDGMTADNLNTGADVIEGYCKVTPPYFTNRLWAAGYTPRCGEMSGCAAAFGYVSLRHHHRLAAAGFFDGHTGTLGEDEMQDMRHWADQADHASWKVEFLVP